MSAGKKKSGSENKNSKPGEKEFPGYPHYPESQDVYNQDRIEEELDPEQTDKKKITERVQGGLNEKDFRSDVSGADLDVPGAENDDAQEAIGSEDEENNHYSLGGDDKENLEEDPGDRR